MQKRAVLRNVLGDCNTSGKELLFGCPFCKHHKRKLSVNIDKNVWKCWVCDKSGKKVFQLIKKFGEYEDIRKWVALDKTIQVTENDLFLNNLFAKEEKEKEMLIDLPSDFISLCNENVYENTFAAKKYLNSRGIDNKKIKKWRIGFCPYGPYEKRVIIPSFNIHGDVNFFVARSYSGDKMKYKNPKVPRTEMIFNELYIDWKKPVYIVEGVFDAIRFKKNSIPLLGSTLSKRHKLFKKIVENNTTVYLGLDADADKKANKIMKLLSQYGIECYRINTAGYEDIAEMPDKVLVSRVLSSQHMEQSDHILNKLRSISL